jgi:hypothetical protein
MFNYHEDAAFAAHRYREAQMLREAELERMGYKAQVERPTLHRQLLAKTGELLISAGTTLKQRAESLPSAPELGQDIRRA